MNHAHTTTSLTQMAISATLHCLTGCAIGEVAGMVIGTAYNLSNSFTVILSIVLAFVFGYALSMWTLLRSGMALQSAFKIVLAADTLSILTMEIVDNLVVIAIPGALNAQLNDVLFWGSLAVSLVIAFIVAVPVNRYMIARGKGHAVMHGHH
jgi:hypothetical protein